MMTRSLIVALAGLGSVAGYCYYRGKCARNTHREVKEDLKRWEGEGGNVPAVATPTPQPRPKSSFPDAGMGPH